MIPFLDLARTNAPHAAELTAAATRVIERGWYVLGGEVEAFEREYATYCGRAHCVGVGNALDGLELTLRALGTKPGDEVVVPSNTYIATWLAVSALGATPVPVEPHPDSMVITGDALAAAVTPRTVGVVPVHLYGRLAEPGVVAAARAHGLWVVADAAQSHGARWSSGPLATDADVYSFYPTKNLGALGDAGAVVTDDAGLADKVRVLRNYGSRRKYDNEVRGRNSRLDELQAALLRVKLPHLDAGNARRRDLVERYRAALAGEVHVAAAAPEPGAHVWHVLNVSHPARDELQRALTERGVGTQVFYPTPPHLSPAYADTEWGAYPVAERLARTTLALPLAPYLTESEVAQVAEAVRGAVAAL